VSYLSSFDISGYGLSAQRFRLNVISSNIANANTTRTDEGGPYRRRSVIFKAENFDKILNEKIQNSSGEIQYENPIDETNFENNINPAIMSVRVDKVVRDDKPFTLKYEPDHPDANSDGYVAYPNINPVIEMADMIEATRAYQANVSAFQNAKMIAQSAIDLMKG
jgi:flagellar basal-body rod protein FlgC